MVAHSWQSSNGIWCSRSQARACPRCRLLTESSTPQTADQDPKDHQVNQDSPQQMQRQEEEEESLKAQIRELEQDLAQTKLKMVEAKCRIQVRAEKKSSLIAELSVLVFVWMAHVMIVLMQGAGAREGDPGQRPPGSKEQLDQQGLHLPPDLQRRGPSWHQHTQRWSALTGPELARKLPAWMELQEVFLASQRHPRELLVAGPGAHPDR